MKKTITITSLILSAMLILDSMNAGSALVLFIIAGQIPGTQLSIDAGSMLFVLMLLSGIVAGRLTSKLFATMAQTSRLRRVINR